MRAAMKVVVVAHPAIRASNRAVYRRLAERGLDVTLVVPDRWKSVLGGTILPDPEEPGSPLKLIVRKKIGIAHSNLFFMVPGIDDLIPRGERCAVYVDQDPAGLMAFQAAIATHRKGAGLVFMSMQNILKKYPMPFNAIQKYVFARAGACVAGSKECRTVVVQRSYTGPVSILSFGYELVPLANDERERVAKTYGFSRPSIGYVGRLVPEKGVDLLIKAFAKVGHAELVIGGDGPSMNELQALVRTLDLEDRVHFLGNLAPNEAVRLIGALDVCTLPSRTTKAWKEQFGRTAVEAMAQGVPMIGSSSAAIPEVIGDAGLIFEEGNVDAFAACILRALDPVERAAIIEKSLERANREFSLDASANTLHRALEESIPK